MKRAMKQDNNHNVLGEVIRCFFNLVACSPDKKSARLGVVENIIQLMNNNYAGDEYIQVVYVYGCGFLDKFMFCCNKKQESIVVDNNGITAIITAMESVFEARGGLVAAARVVEGNECDSNFKRFALALLGYICVSKPRARRSALCDEKEAPPGNNGECDDDDDDETYVPPTDDNEEEEDKASKFGSPWSYVHPGLYKKQNGDDFTEYSENEAEDSKDSSNSNDPANETINGADNDDEEDAENLIGTLLGTGYTSKQ